MCAHTHIDARTASVTLTPSSGTRPLTPLNKAREFMTGEGVWRGVGWWGEEGRGVGFAVLATHRCRGGRRL